MEDKNVKLVLKQELPDRNPIFTIKGLLAQAKRYLLCWLVVAIVSALVVTCITGVLQRSEVSAKTLVEFTFDGIESGKDPSGNAFDVAAQMKSPVVIERALENAAIGEELTVDAIRNAITVKGHIPKEEYDKMTAYKSIFESGNVSISSVETMINNSYHPTRYTLELNADKAGLDTDQSVVVLDAVVTAYKEYFFEKYGYNRALGVSVAAVDYKDYDYERAVEVLDTAIGTARRYLNTLSSEDSTGYRSNTTGYTFSDLSAALATIQSEDLDWLNSYIVVNCVTKDKNALITNYEYRVDNLLREKTAAEEVLAGINDSIATYEKDTILVTPDANGDSMTLNQSSQAYDNMIAQRISKQEEIASLASSIAYYEGRILALRSTTSVATSGSRAYVEEELTRVYDKLTGLLNQVELTADEYYSNVAFSDVFSVLVPANTAAVSQISALISAVMVPVLLLEFLIFAAYIVLVAWKAYAAQHSVIADTDADDVKDSDAAETVESARALKRKNKKD